MDKTKINILKTIKKHNPDNIQNDIKINKKLDKMFIGNDRDIISNLHGKYIMYQTSGPIRSFVRGIWLTDRGNQELINYDLVKTETDEKAKFINKYEWGIKFIIGGLGITIVGGLILLAITKHLTN